MRSPRLTLIIGLGLGLAAGTAGCRKSAAPPPAPAQAAPATPAARTSSAAAEAAAPDTAPWRKDVPKGEAPKAPVLPSFKTANLKNGLTIIVPDQRSLLPLVSFELVSIGGAATDPPGKAGLAALTFAMMAEGAGKRDAIQFSDAVANLGAGFNAAADRDHAGAAIGGLKRHSEAMLGLLADAVLAPRLAAKDFDRRKSQTVAELQRQRGSPQTLALEAAPALIYGADHPYGHPPSGTVETVPTLTLADVKGNWKRLVSPKTSALVAAGDITLEEAVKLAEKHFGKWAQAAPALPTIAEVKPEPRTAVVLLDKKNAPQTMELIGRPIFGRGSADEAPMTVLNEIYGGAFTSRLNMDLREDKGYTYHAESQATYRLGCGVFLAYSAIRQDATAQGLVEMFKQLDGLRTNPPTDEEVALAKAGIIRGLTGAFERNRAIARAADAIFVYRLPLDYYGKLADKYESVTTAAVRDVAARYLDPALMKVLLVGDAKVIKEPVEKDGLGPVVVRDKP